jgi:hypothetical protein
MAAEPADGRRAEALKTVRLSDPELGGLAELATGALASASDYSPGTTKEQMEQDRKLEDERRARTLEELRAWVSNREADAYLRGADAATDRESRSAYNTRSIVLLLVVLAVVSMPLLAMVQGLEPEKFGSYIAPITGIAGTVVGYWFGTVGRPEGSR